MELLLGIFALSDYLLCVSHTRETEGPDHTQKDVENNSIPFPSVCPLLKDGKKYSTTAKKRKLVRDIFYFVPGTFSIFQFPVEGPSQGS